MALGQALFHGGGEGLRDLCLNKLSCVLIARRNVTICIKLNELPENLIVEVNHRPNSRVVPDWCRLKSFADLVDQGISNAPLLRLMSAKRLRLSDGSSNQNPYFV